MEPKEPIPPVEKKKKVMPKRTSTTPVRVYKYGLLPPIEGGEYLREQIWLADRYYNKRIEIGMASRVEKDKARATASPGFDKLSERKTELIGEIEAADKAGDKDRLKALVAERKEVTAKLREARKALKDNEEVAALVAKVAADTKVIENNARKSSGVFWGTYLGIEAAARQALAAPRPRFRRHNGNGLVGNQFQGGITKAEVLSCMDTRLQIKPLPEGIELLGRHQRRKASRTLCRLRIQSDEKNKPMWVTFPMIMHRPLPDDAKITWAKVSVRHVGRRPEYTLLLTVESETFHRRSEATVDAVAVDLGWRRTVNGVRVAYWRDTNGDSGEILVPQEVPLGLEKVASLQSIRDMHMNEVRLKLMEWKTTQGEWVRENLSHVHVWRSPKQVVRFAGNARREGIELPDFVEAFLLKDRHLMFWAEQQRDRRLNRRRDFYRNVAAQFARKYKHIILEDFRLPAVREKQTNLRDDATAKEKKTDSGSVAMRRQANVAAPGEFRLAMSTASSTYGARVIVVDPAYTSMTCHICGYKKPWKDKSELLHRCEGCDTVWDRDSNAAHNLLARGLDALKTPLPLDMPKEPEITQEVEDDDDDDIEIGGDCDGPLEAVMLGKQKN